MRRSSSVVVLGLLLAACGQTTAPGAQTSAPIYADEPAATLAFSPATLSLNIGEIAEVKVMLDLKGRASQTYQAEITYDPAIIEIVDADDKTKGIQVAAGLYETSVDNTVDAAAGRIRLLGYSLTPGKEVTGSGTLATIQVRGKGAGAATLSFDRAAGDSTSKTKVILKGETNDVLKSTGTLPVTVTQ